MPIRCRPHDGLRDLRLPRDGTRAIPDWRLERIGELVAAGPTLDMDQQVELPRHRLVTAAAGNHVTFGLAGWGTGAERYATHSAAELRENQGWL